VSKLNEIEKEILKEEKMSIDEVVKPINDLINDPDEVDSIVSGTLKILDKEGILVDEDTVRDAIDNLWDIFHYEVEYVPGYADEYVEEIKNAFYSKKGVSKKKIAEFLAKNVY